MALMENDEKCPVASLLGQRSELDSLHPMLIILRCYNLKSETFLQIGFVHDAIHIAKDYIHLYCAYIG